MENGSGKENNRIQQESERTGMEVFGNYRKKQGYEKKNGGKVKKKGGKCEGKASVSERNRKGK